MAIEKKWSDRHGREVWGYIAKIGGKRRRKFGFSSYEAAELALSLARINHFERKEGVAKPGARPAVTVRRLVERRGQQLQSSPRRRASARTLAAWCDTLPAGLLVTELSTEHLLSWMAKRLGEVKPQSVFRELTDICSMLSSARDLFHELEDWKPPRRPRLKVPTGARDRLIAHEEAAAVLTWLRRPKGEDEPEAGWRVRIDAADLLQIALLTAARKTEIISLRWSDVNFEWKTLRVTGTKTERVRVIPMVEPLVALLRRRKVAAGRSPLVFPALAHSTVLTHADKIFAEASAAVGVPYGHKAPGGWVLHDARHTAVTAMLHAGASLESVMAISGHGAQTMALRYAHSNETTRRAAVSALEQYGGQNVPLSLHGEAQGMQTVQRMQEGPPKKNRRKVKGK